MALGATLVADDQTTLFTRSDELFATCPSQIRGRIEARGVGILAAETVLSTRLHLVVDLDQQETDRLPQRHRITFLGHKIPLLHTPVHPHFPAVILQYLKGGRCD